MAIEPLVEDAPRLPVRPDLFAGIPPRDPCFVGRESLLRQIEARLATGTVAVIPKGRLGPAEVGKSALAAEYARRHRDDYDVVWWVPASNPVHFAASLVALAGHLGLRVGGEANVALPALRDALRSRRPGAGTKVLVILDDAAEPEATLRHVPGGEACHVLVTSNSSRWAGTATPVRVGTLTRSESIQLLRRRSHNLGYGDADRIAEVLGDLPLALEQAAAYHEMTGIRPEKYTEILAAEMVDLRDICASLGCVRPSAAAWTVSATQVSRTDPGAVELLRLCSALAPESIPVTFLQRGQRVLAAEESNAALPDPDRISHALRTIERFALARVDRYADTIQVYQSARTLMLGRMPAAERAALRHSAHLVLAANDPNAPNAPSCRSRYAELYPHLVVTDAATTSADVRVRELVLNEMRYLYRWGYHEASCDLAQHTYDAWQSQFGETDPQTLRAARWLGWMLFVVGRHADAADVNKRVLEVCERSREEEHDDTLDALGNVAADLRIRGDFDAALELADEIYRRYVRAVGEKDPAALDAAHNLAVSLRLSGMFAAARDLDECTWRNKVGVFGEDHELTLITLEGLVADRLGLGDYSGACATQETTVNTYRRNFDDNYPRVLGGLRILATARLEAGDPTGARVCAEEAYHRISRRYGQEHLSAMHAALILSVAYQHLGDLEAARELGAQTRDHYRRVLGEAHPHSLAANVGYAVTCRLAGDVDAARQTELQTYENLRGALGEDHVLTLLGANAVANGLYFRGAFQDAGIRDSDTVQRLAGVLGKHHPTTLLCTNNLAVCLRAAGRPQEAEELHSECVAHLRRVLGESHPATRSATAWNRAECAIIPPPL